MANEPSVDYEKKAKGTFAVERKEDLVVLLIAAATVALVLAGVIDSSFYPSLFIKY